MLTLVEGDRDGALETIAQMADASTRLLDPFEKIGLELAVRAPAMILFGHDDARVAELHRQMRSMFDHVPSAFMQVRLAMGDMLTGEREAARRRASRWLGDPAAAFEAPDPVGSLGLMAVMADEFQLAEPVPALAELLREFSGLLAGAVPIPVDLLLARLEMVIGNSGAAVERAQRALGFARSMPSPVSEAHGLCALAEAQTAAGDRAAAAVAVALAEAVAERTGVALAPGWSRRSDGRLTSSPIGRAHAAASSRTAQLTRDRDVWRLVCGSESGTLVHIAGLTQLARLVQVPGLEIAATELTPAADVSQRSLGPALDARAKRQYRQRINDLRAEIDEAERWNDFERVESARSELDALIAELRRAVGMGGRDRPQGSGSERARVNVARSIRRAITAIDKVAPQLAAHLAVSVRTGHHCSYAPEPGARVEWEVALGD
jgi:hypothetical protein